MYLPVLMVSIVLPDKLTKIRVGAFADCQNLTGSLVIPEGVVSIEEGAFCNCKSLTGSLSLPSTLKEIGKGNDRWCFLRLQPSLWKRLIYKKKLKMW